MPLNEHLFRSARLRNGHRSLSAEKTLVQVRWEDDADRFDPGSASIVATAVADLDVPANNVSLKAGQVWEMEAEGEAGRARFQVLAVRLVEVRPGPSRHRRWYTWQFLVVRKPGRDPYRLFPRPAGPSTLDEISEEGDILGDLKRLLASEVADAAVARFTSEGGFQPGEA